MGTLDAPTIEGLSLFSTVEGIADIETEVGLKVLGGDVEANPVGVLDS